jgi:uncharacterized repeat protein (TIGR01451 family)
VTASSAAPARRRGAFVALLALIAGLLAPVVFAAPASAATIAGLVTGFQIDGDKTAVGGSVPKSAFDWDDFITGVTDAGAFTFTPTGPYVPAAGYTSTGIIQADFFWDNGTKALSCPPPGTADGSSFQASATINSSWTITPEQVNNKGDGCSGGTAYEVVTQTSNQEEHHVLYQYWTRNVGNGDMSTYQILAGGVAGRCGDYLVEFNYDSPQNKNDVPKTTVNIYDWDPTASCASAGGVWTIFDDDFPHHAALGARTEGPGTLPGDAETFGEIAIDLTDAGLFDDGACTAFQASGYITKTGNGGTSQLIDYVGDSTPMTISNCGAITIRKAGLPAEATTAATFDYVLERTSTGQAHDGSLAGTDGTVAVVDTQASTTKIGAALALSAQHTWTGIYAGSYQLTESITTGIPWGLSSMSCTVTNPSTNQTETANTIVNGTTVTAIPVYTAATTHCVITNATSSVVIEKTAVGGSGSFGFDLNGSPGSAEVTIDTAVASESTPIAYAPGTEVTITELLGTLNTAVDPDWALDSISCTGPEQTSGSSVTVTTVAGQETVCTFTNERNGSISIEKTAIGGTGSFTFALQLLDGENQPVGAPQSATAVVTTPGGTGAATFDNVTPGATYSLAEVGVDASWTAGALHCLRTPASGTAAAIADLSAFTVNPGDSIACTITNTKKGTIVVVKNVAGANGTFDFTRSWPEVDTPFTLTTTSPSNSKSETFSNLLPGSYSISEIAESGYDGALSCNDANSSTSGLTATLQLDAGETITCTWTNTERGTLVVVKETTPDKSLESFAFEWSPEGGSSTGFSLTDGTSYSTTLAPGDYSVTELAESGWSLTGLTCTAAEDQPTGTVDGAEASVTIVSGETITCTYTNAQRGKLTLDKAVSGAPSYNGNGTWTVTYALTVTSESYIAESYDLKDEFDFGAGIAIVSEDVSGPVGVTLNSGWNGVSDLLVADNAEIPARGTHTYTVTVVVNPPAELAPTVADCDVAENEGTGLLNSGSITFWGEGSDDDTACAPVPIADLTIDKTSPFSIDFEPEVGPTSFSYQIVVTNLGPNTAYGVVLEDPLPNGLDFVSASGVGATCGFAAGVVTCQLGDLVKDQSRTITLSVSVPVDYPLPNGEESFTIENEASTSTQTAETDLTNNEDDASTVVLVTLPLPPEDPEVPTLALTGAAIGWATQLGLSLLLVGIAFAGMSLRRRSGGRHVA